MFQEKVYHDSVAVKLFIYQKRIIRYTVKRACALIRIFIAILTIRDRVSKYAHAAANF